MRRPPGSGHVYQPTYKGRDRTVRKARTWWLQWTDAAGKRHAEPAKGAKTRTQAEAILRDRLAERDAGREPKKLEKGRIA